MPGTSAVAPSASAGLHPGDDDPQFLYDGRTGELFRLWLKTLLLSIGTLGFYRFWGRTRLRKYLWSRVRLAGDRFEYDGTGGELFRRFLVALLVLVPVFFMPDLLLLLGVGPAVVDSMDIASFPLLLFLIEVGRYGGRRYRISRTLWRGIRGGLDGSSVGYALRGVKYMILAPLTLGLSLPWQIVGLWRYEMNNTGLGDGQFRFEGGGRDLLGAYLRSMGCGLAILAATILLILGIILAVIGLSSLGVLFEDPDADDWLPVVEHMFLLFGLIFPTVVLALLAEVAVVMRFELRAIAHLARGTRLGEVGFAAKLRLWPLLRLNIGNGLIALATLGTGSAFLAHRTLRFYCRNLRLSRSATLEALTQAPGRRRPSGGEGLLQLLDTSGFA